MSSGQKAVADDEDDWDDFKSDHSLRHNNWKVYSAEERFAREGWKTHKFTGLLLEKYVKICLDLEAAKNQFMTKLEVLKSINKI